MGFLLNFLTMELLEWNEIFSLVYLNNLENLDPEDQSLWKMTRQVMWISTPSSTLVTPGGLVLSDSKKAEALADSLEAQFQPVNDPSIPAIIEVINDAMRAYSFAPSSEPKLPIPTEVQDAIRGFKVGKTPGPAVFRTGPWSIFHQVSFPSLSCYFFERSTSRRFGNTHACFRPWNLGRIRRCRHLIDPSVC